MTGLERLRTNDGKYALMEAVLSIEGAIGRRLNDNEIERVIVMMARALEPKPVLH